jgi:hypothetical protein
MTEQNGSVQTGNPAPEAGAQQGQWFETFQDASIKEWAATKGWKSPESAVQSAWHLEKLMGADKAGRGVIWPKDENDVDGWKAVYTKLGRPETPEGYDVKLPEGSDDTYLKSILPALHEAGVPKSKMQKILETHEAFAAKYQEQQENEWAEASNKQFESLQKEWGNDFERNSEMARRATRMAGISKEQAEAIEKVLGVDGAAKMFAVFGENYVEHASPGHFNTGGDTSASAKARIAELKADKEFGVKILNGDANAKAEWDKLHKIAFQ